MIFTFHRPQKSAHKQTSLQIPDLCTASLLLGGSSEESENADVAALGLLTGWLGLWFGPGAGYLYAHHPWGFWRGALIRIGGTGLMIISLAATWDDPGASGGLELFIGGTVALLAALFMI